VVVIVIDGSDVGEFEDAPFRELAADLSGGEDLEIFIDGRATQGASIDVSNDWAQWLGKHRSQLAQVTMLTGSRFLRITADFVRRFAQLGDVMRVTSEPDAFDEALEEVHVPPERRSSQVRVHALERLTQFQTAQEHLAEVLLEVRGLLERGHRRCRCEPPVP
jgi:hypothetical protein